MIKLNKYSDLRFCALIDTSKKGKESVIDIALIDPAEDIRRDENAFKKIAASLAFEFFEAKEDRGLILSSTSKRVENDLIIELERFEVAPKMPEDVNPIYALVFKASHDSANTNRCLKQRNRELEQKSKLLKKEVRELIELVEKLERTKESLRIPFNAIKDLMISFDSGGNILIVNEASTEWFGQTPEDVIRRKYKTILRQNITEMIQKVSDSEDSLVLEEKIGSKMLQITYVPMTNKKTGETEVVMLAQDITSQKKTEEERIESARNEGVTVMGATVRHILNSSLTAILGFSQLALSSYEWPRETMAKYLKLIERTAQRMKRELNKIAEQKEYKTTTYLRIPKDEECREIIKIDMDHDEGEG